MKNGKCEDAVQWIQSRNHSLGERSWSRSKRLVDGLSAKGCAKIYVCEIDIYEDSFENTGHLVVELPSEATARSKVLKMIARFAYDSGYSGPFDDGQMLEYIKLD
jgi:hypothetical protein